MTPRATVVVSIAVAVFLSGIVLAQNEPLQQALFRNIKVFHGVDESHGSDDVLVTGNLIDQVSTEPLANVNEKAVAAFRTMR
jgi:hypothetical protein